MVDDEISVRWIVECYRRLTVIEEDGLEVGDFRSGRSSGEEGGEHLCFLRVTVSPEELILVVS